MKNLTVSFSGEGLVNVVPDEALVNLTVQCTSRVDLGTAISTQAEKAKNLLNYLRGVAKVPESKITTSNYQNGPVKKRDRDTGEYTPTGDFLAVQNLEVRVPRSLAGEVSGQVAKWATVDQTNFVVSRELLKKTREESTELAISDAEYRAKNRAKRLGLSLGKVVGFSESTGGNSNRHYAGGRQMNAMAETLGGSPELTAGETEVETSVVVTYKLNRRP